MPLSLYFNEKQNGTEVASSIKENDRKRFVDEHVEIHIGKRLPANTAMQ